MIKCANCGAFLENIVYLFEAEFYCKNCLGLLEPNGKHKLKVKLGPEKTVKIQNIEIVDVIKL